MRYNIPEKREVSQDPDQDVYFWDGSVCVRSSVITIGNPPTNTISIQNLQGVSLSKGKRNGFLVTIYIIGLLFLTPITALSIWLDKELKAWIISFGLSLINLWLFIRFCLEIRPLPWAVTMKMGGMLADEVFTSRNQKWAEQFSQAVSQAIMIEQHRRGGGGQTAYQPEPVFPDSTNSRN